jgi:hypothetical protein
MCIVKNIYSTPYPTLLYLPPLPSALAKLIELQYRHVPCALLIHFWDFFLQISLHFVINKFHRTAHPPPLPHPAKGKSFLSAKVS